MFPEIDASLAEVRAELWRRGDLSWLYHDGQHVLDSAFEETTGQEVAIEVARQFGKSTWGVGKSCETAILNPGCSTRVATSFYSDLRNIILPAFRFILLTAPPDVRPTFNSSTGVFRFPPPYNSEIGLVGLDRNPEKLRGSRLRLVLIDEAGFCNSDKLKYTHQNVIIPATTHEPDARVVFLSTTPPEGQDHYFIEVCDRASLVGGHVMRTIYDNPMLTPQRIEELARSMGGKDSIAFRREMLCERIVDAERAIVPEFNEKKHVVETPRPHYFQFLHQYECLDSGVRDKTAILFAYYDFPRAKLVIEDELILSGSQVTTRNIADGVRMHEKDLEYGKLYRRVADNDNLILLNDLGSAEELHFYPTDKDSREAMVNAVRMMFHDNRVEIHPRCKFLIGSLRSCLWNDRRDDFERSVLYGHADAVAALVYLIRNLDRYTNPIPAWFGAPQSETIIINPSAVSDTVRTVSGALFGGVR